MFIQIIYVLLWLLIIRLVLEVSFRLLAIAPQNDGSNANDESEFSAVE